MAAPASGRYLLDTNICIYIAKHQPPQVRRRFEALPVGSVAMSVVTFGELRFGAEKSQRREESLAALDKLTRSITVTDLPGAAGEHYGRARAELQRIGRPIGGNDLWIAAHALAEGWTLVTNNVAEFERVPGLVIENWADASGMG
ncbi:MAG: type II toxin-antitoxin system VapC family toxin [Burkholderiales bacterium]|nr:type II toxin-antitoxin system VapC family toxin [Burkholderiales bacterium]